MEFAFGKIGNCSSIILLNAHYTVVVFRFIFRYFRKFVRIFSDLFERADFTVLNLRDNVRNYKKSLKNEFKRNS